MQSLRYTHFTVLSDYFKFFKILLGVTVSLIQKVYAEFGIYFSQRFLLLYLYILDIYRSTKFIVFTLSIVNNSCARYWPVLVIVFNFVCFFFVGYIIGMVESLVSTQESRSMVMSNCCSLSSPVGWILWFVWIVIPMKMKGGLTSFCIQWKIRRLFMGYIRFLFRRNPPFQNGMGVEGKYSFNNKCVPRCSRVHQITKWFYFFSLHVLSCTALPRTHPAITFLSLQ